MTGVALTLAAVVACTACCLPLLAPVVASMFAGAGAYCLDDVVNPLYVVGAAAIAFAATSVWRRCRRQSRMGIADSACGCQGGCGEDATSSE